MKSSTVHLLLNPARRQRERSYRRISEALAARGADVVELRPPSADAVPNELTAAIGQGMHRLVIAGGDGLIHRSLPALAHSEVDVGIVGVGSGNDFAQSLGLPSNLDHAIDVALGPTRPIDLIVNEEDRYAASVVTLGFSGQVTARGNAIRLPLRQFRYVVATLMELPRLRPIQLEMHIDGTRYDLAASLIAIGNTASFGGGMAICPEALPDDGLLAVTVIGDTNGFTLGRLLPTVFSARHVHHPKVTTYVGAEVTVRTLDQAEPWADGEVFAGQTFMVDRAALRVAYG